MKKLDNLNLIQDLYEIFSYFTKEINILIEQNKEKIIENTDKLHNLADFSFYDKRIIALETDNREKNEKITEITKKNVILTAVSNFLCVFC